jgi:hypothetical protein
MRKRRKAMRTNSGGGKAKNNNHNPTLRDHENARGKSGEAIQGSKKVAAQPSRKESRTESSPQ